MITAPIWFFDTWLAVAWAISPLGYLCTLLAPGNATVLASSITFVLCAFMNGFFGLVLSSLVKDGAMRTLLNISPGKASFFLLFFGNAVESPFGEGRAWAITKLQENGFLPDFECAHNNYTCISLERDAVLQEELGISGWRKKAYVDLILFGLICRVVALALFCGRSKVKLAGTWRHLRHGPAGRFQQVCERIISPTLNHRQSATLRDQDLSLHRTTSCQLPGTSSQILVTRQSYGSGKFSRLDTEPPISGHTSASVTFSLNTVHPPPPPPATPQPWMHGRYSGLRHSVAPAAPSPRESIQQRGSRQSLELNGMRPGSSRTSGKASTARYSVATDGRRLDRSSNLVSDNI